jgi:hypothetical protein
MAGEAVDVLTQCTDLLDDIKQFKGRFSCRFKLRCRLRDAHGHADQGRRHLDVLQSRPNRSLGNQKGNFQKHIALTDRL